MSKLLEFGGGDMDVESSEINLIKSVKQYNRVKSNKKKEVLAFHTIMQEFKKEMVQLVQNEQREQNFNTIGKLLSEYEAEFKEFEEHNEQLRKIFETFVKHEHTKYEEIVKSAAQIINEIEIFKESLETSIDVDKKENDELISTMCEKLEKMHEKYVIQQKKAKLELFVKKLIQEEDLF